MSGNDHNAPGKEFRAGTITAAIWTKATVLDGKSIPQHSIRVQKRYRDERSGEWKTTTYFHSPLSIHMRSRTGAPDTSP